MDDSMLTTTGRRKRPHVPEASRKRVARACEQCRRVKEKCEGGTPCSRCTRLHRVCRSSDEAVAKAASEDLASETTRTDFFDRERIAQLERIVLHYAGDLALDEKSLKRHLSSRELDHPEQTRAKHVISPPDSTSSRVEHDLLTRRASRPTSFIGPGELSHCKFFDDVQNQIHNSSASWHASREKSVTATVVTSRRARLHSDRSIILRAAQNLPPIEVSKFLAEMFFKYASTNYMYLEEASLYAMLEQVYTKASTLKADDAPMVCMLLMVLALGTQFAHLSSSAEAIGAAKWEESYCDDIASPDDNVTLVLYHAATTLLPDVLAIATIESIQAILLLGVYTLPIDAASLSYSYLSIALRLAIQTNMHRKSAALVDPSEIESHNRIWWTVYSLERRVAVFHGMPASLARAEVDAELPRRISDSLDSNTIDIIPNFLAIIKLTGLFEDAGRVICAIRQASDNNRTSESALMDNIANELASYWSTLPEEIYCKDLDPSGPLFRSNVHLALNYHMGRIFIGRTFIFESTDPILAVKTTSEAVNSWPTIRTRLVSDCVDSAIATVALCRLIQDQVGLARASYTEFTTCRTAVLVILARRVQKNDHELQIASEKGLELLKYMSVGIYSAAAEKAAITAMEVAVGRLNRRTTTTNQSSQSTHQPKSAYHNFRNWALLWSGTGTEQLTSSLSDANSSSLALTNHGKEDSGGSNSSVPYQALDLDFFSNTFSFDMDEFAPLPGFDTEFDFRFNSQLP